MALSTLQRRDTTSARIEQRRSPVASLEEIFRRASIADDLAAVERQLRARTASRSSLLAESGAYIIAAGGKRLRAALVLLMARLGEYDPERAVHPAASVELLHGASLIHDDLVDHADRRRGHVTVHTRWDNGVALMLGDYFFALSADELSAEPDSRIIRFYADAAHTIVEGELSPVTRLEPLSTAIDQYIYKIGCKTAALFVAACKAGMTVAGGTPEQIEIAGRFGYDLGLAFQIVDDVLDFVGDEATLGKPAGNDLREGTWTLPLLYTVDSSDDPMLRDVVETGHVKPEQVTHLVDLVVKSGGVARAMSEAHYIADRAFRQLDGFPPSPTKRALADVCEFVLARRA